MQLSLIDPRQHPVLTAAMLDDTGLKDAINFVRWRAGRPGGGWPYVEALCVIEGRQAWLVDDAGDRYVVVRSTVFPEADLRIADEKLRTAAWAAFERLDAVAPDTKTVNIPGRC